MNTDWRSYPFRLVADGSRLEFPAAEGEHADQESDTWFIAGELIGATGRSFAFFTIFNKNRPSGTVVADFYTMALFDCDAGAYGTYTDYDMPPASTRPDVRSKLLAAAGHLDIRYDSGAGTVAWTTRRDDAGESGAYTDPCPPALAVPPGGSADGAGFDCRTNSLAGAGWCVDAQRQDHLFRSARHVFVFPDRNGDDWDTVLGALCEQVSGNAGHVDRQWFPKYVGGGGTGGYPRARSHEWRTINLDNGVDREYSETVRPRGR